MCCWGLRFAFGAAAQNTSARAPAGSFAVRTSALFGRVCVREQGPPALFLRLAARLRGCVRERACPLSVFSWRRGPHTPRAQADRAIGATRGLAEDVLRIIRVQPLGLRSDGEQQRAVLGLRSSEAVVSRRGGDEEARRWRGGEAVGRWQGGFEDERRWQGGKAVVRRQGGEVSRRWTVDAAASCRRRGRVANQTVSLGGLSYAQRTYLGE